MQKRSEILSIVSSVLCFDEPDEVISILGREDNIAYPAVHEHVIAVASSDVPTQEKIDEQEPDETSEEEEEDEEDEKLANVWLN